jgi:ABC-type bacteriocin/lantibiotic exporter with double-glycine peptidase domain
LRIPRNGTIAITAPSGCGKTTMLGVLCGLLGPQTGEVMVDGVSLTKLDTQAWQSGIGLVMQENPMFHASLRENIAWGSGVEIDDERILEVCRVAGVLDFIEHLPAGLDTVIGDQGSRLSGGQRQRLALARALYRAPSLLLLDEPTSALDAENELRLIESLKGIQGEIAMVIVSHRGAILSLADTVYELG